MTVDSGHSTAEIRILQRCISDLVSVLALPATWSGGEPSQIVRTLLESLPGMLHLDLVYVRVNDRVGGSPIEMFRVGTGPPEEAGAAEIGRILYGWMGADPEIRPQRIPNPAGTGKLTILPLRLGLNGEIGVIVAGAARDNFPGQTERLVLSVAANQALIGLQQAQLLIKEMAEHRLADERLRLEEDELRRSEARKAAILDSALDSIVTIDHEGCITEFNPAAERTFGYRRADVMGRPLAEVIIAPSLRDAHRRGFARYLATGEATVLGKRIEMTAVRADGTEFPVELTITRIPSDGPPAFTGYLRDITERRQAEEALARVRSELAHVTRVTSLGVLTASIAHEVNQPLSGIITNASTCLRMLAADPPNLDGARETARRTIRDGHRASDVITRLRALFGKQAPTVESVDLNEAAREVVALSLTELQRRRVTVRTELAKDLPPITGDRVQLQQVILNLLLNASDAMASVEDRPRRLVIRTDRDEGDQVRLTVQDTGVGIDFHSVDRLFDAFYTTKTGGMGIGLSISRSIIESHHGHLWAAPNDGPGASFIFSIPHSAASGRP
jgi:PAS domain S-box-containing protein